MIGLINFIYIGIMMIGLVALIFTLLLYRTGKNVFYQAVTMFFLTIFIYMVVDYVTYFFLTSDSSPTLVYGCVTLSDTLSIVMMCAWQWLIIVTGKMQDRLKLRYVLIFNGLYMIGQEGDTLFSGTFNPAADALNVTGIGTYTSLIFSTIYYIVMIATAVYVFAKKVGTVESRFSRYAAFIFSASLVVYSIWLFWWDYEIWFKEQSGIMEDYGSDPIFIIYAILCVTFMLYFRLVDPLHFRNGQQQEPKYTLDDFCEEFGISAREKEVLADLRNGRSNSEISDHLMISENTVKKHVSNLMKKTESKNRYELMHKTEGLSRTDGR